MYLFMVSFYIAVIIAITDGMFLSQKLYKRLYVSFLLNNYEVVTIIHSVWVMRVLGLSYRPKVIWALNGEARINWASHTELVDIGGGPWGAHPSEMKPWLTEQRAWVLEPVKPGFQAWLQHLLPVEYWVSILVSLTLSFPNWKNRGNNTLQVCWADSMN